MPATQEHPAEPLTAYRELLIASLTDSPNQPLLIVTKGTVIPVTVSMLVRALAVMIQSLELYMVLYSLHSPRRGVQLPHTEWG